MEGSKLGEERVRSQQEERGVEEGWVHERRKKERNGENGRRKGEIKVQNGKRLNENMEERWREHAMSR